MFVVVWPLHVKNHNWWLFWRRTKEAQVGYIMDYQCRTCEYLKDELPATEAANPLSQDIDVCKPEELVVLFDRIDHEIYGLECQCCHGILSEETARKIDFLSSLLSSKLKASECNDGAEGKRATLIFSGSGTSGRLGFFTCRTFSACLKKFINLKYLISGGDKALITSNEGVEDDSDEGVKCFRNAQSGEKDVILIGITCGLHSPFVGGQLYHILSNDSGDFTRYPILLGFNHVKHASKTSVNKSKKSFYDLALDMSRSEKQALVINPVLGPELLTGSSRMKGGTATKIILDSLMISLLSKAKLGQSVPFARLGQLFKNSLKLAYQDKGTLSSLIRLAGDSLHCGGHLYYVGLDSYGSYGILDSTECVPTFGSSLNDVRGFVANGYDCLGNIEGDLSCDGFQYDISLEYFGRSVEPGLTEHDCVILIGTSLHIREMEELAASISKHNSAVGILLLNCVSQSSLNCKANTYPTIWLGEDGLEEECRKCFCGSDMVVEECATLLHRCILELALKLVLNALSTGAFILCGKVVRNFMIDIKVSNTKLFHRAARIVSQFTDTSLEESTQLLLRALHRKDILTPDVRNMTIQQHTALGANTDKVVPVAILMGLAACRVEEALRLLANTSSVRKCLSSFLEGEHPVPGREPRSQMSSLKWNTRIVP